MSETHYWRDGERAWAYSERPADIRLLIRLLGRPSRVGRGGVVAFWDAFAPDTLRLAKRSKRNLSPEARQAARDRALRCLSRSGAPDKESGSHGA